MGYTGTEKIQSITYLIPQKDSVRFTGASSNNPISELGEPNHKAFSFEPKQLLSFGKVHKKY